MSPTAGTELGPVHAPSLRDRERAEARARRNPLVWLREILMIIVVALVISSLLRAFVVQVFWIPSPSMRNTPVSFRRPGVAECDHMAFGQFGRSGLYLAVGGAQTRGVHGLCARRRRTDPCQTRHRCRR